MGELPFVGGGVLTSEHSGAADSFSAFLAPVDKPLGVSAQVTTKPLAEAVGSILKELTALHPQPMTDVMKSVDGGVLDFAEAIQQLTMLGLVRVYTEGQQEEIDLSVKGLDVVAATGTLSSNKRTDA